jgi:hypothetical protein
MLKQKTRPPGGPPLKDDEVCAFGGDNGEGWSFEVILFNDRPAGELRFQLHGEPAFAHAIGLEEIALFAAGREDLIQALVERVLRQHVM